MKTYPYHTPDGIIELVEKREYDAITLLAHDLANLRAEDMATINDLRKELNVAIEALQSIHGYWDRDEEEKEMPMKDACWHAVGAAYRALAKLNKHNQ